MQVEQQCSMQWKWGLFLKLYHAHAGKIQVEFSGEGPGSVGMANHTAAFLSWGGEAGLWGGGGA